MSLAYLINELRTSGAISQPHIIRAMENIDRGLFVPADRRSEAYLNEPIAIGYAQTISAPGIVGRMLELLSLEPGHRVLDVGSGSGYQAALLAYIVSHDLSGQILSQEDQGKVIGLELVPELARVAARNISQFNFIKKRVVEIHCLNAQAGYPSGAPYDRIISAAAADQVPSAWINQLKTGGKIVAPIQGQIVAYTKHSDDKIKTEKFDSVLFVPFIEE